MNCNGFGVTIGCAPMTGQQPEGQGMRIVIVGAGQAAASMAARLRAVGPTVFQSDMNASHPENLGRRETSNAWVADSGFCVPWM